MKWNRNGWKAAALSALTVLAFGCSEASDEQSSARSSAPPSGSAYELEAEPAGAVPVKEARESAEENGTVVVVGRIGGSTNPWVEGRAAFSIVDPSLEACSDIPGDACPTPWDYCCEVPALPGATALVKVVDDQGNVVKTDARELLNLEELDTVVARGTAERDDAGNLTILATDIYVRE